MPDHCVSYMTNKSDGFIERRRSAQRRSGYTERDKMHGIRWFSFKQGVCKVEVTEGTCCIAGVPLPSLPSQGQPRVTLIGSSSIPVSTLGTDPRGTLPRDPRTRGQPVASPQPQPNQAPAWTAPPVGLPAGPVGTGPGPAPLDTSFGTGDLLAILASAGVPAPVALPDGVGNGGGPVASDPHAGGAGHVLGGPVVPQPFGGGATDISTDFLHLLTKLQQ